MGFWRVIGAVSKRDLDLSFNRIRFIQPGGAGARVRSSRRHGWFQPYLMIKWEEMRDGNSVEQKLTATARRERPETLAMGRAARLAIRRNQHAGPTSGLAPGFVQANLAILPAALAQDFLHFCHRNPKRATRTSRLWAKISISAPTCRAIACGAPARASTSQTTS